jgi:hypothetical protein
MLKQGGQAGFIDEIIDRVLFGGQMGKDFLYGNRFFKPLVTRYFATVEFGHPPDRDTVGQPILPKLRWFGGRHVIIDLIPAAGCIVRHPATGWNSPYSSKLLGKYSTASNLSNLSKHPLKYNCRGKSPRPPPGVGLRIVRILNSMAVTKPKTLGFFFYSAGGG